MSKGTLGQVVKRAISDAAFRRQLQSDPGGALKGFDLSDEERSALRSGDASKLSALGVDQRMSKAFILGESAAAASKSVSASDVSRSATMPDGGEPLISEGLTSGTGRDANQALISDGAAGARINAREFDSAGGNRAVRDPDNVGGARPSEATGAAYRSDVRDPDNVGGARASQASTGGTQQSQGTAYISADEAGRNVSAGDTAVAGTGARSGDAFLTSDEMGRDVTGGANVASQYPDAAAERAAIEASQQGGDADLARANPDDFGGKPDITA